MQKPPQKILIVRFSSFGDVILVSPLFRAVKQALPDAKVHFVTFEEFASLHQHNPFIDRLISFPRKTSLFAMLHELRQLSQPEAYSLVLDAHGSLRSRALSLLLRLGSIFRLSRRRKLPVVTFRKNYRQRNQLLRHKIFPSSIQSVRERYLAMLYEFLAQNREEPAPSSEPDPASAQLLQPHHFSSASEIFFPPRLQQELLARLAKEEVLSVKGEGYSLDSSAQTVKKFNLALAPGAAYSLKRWGEPNYRKLALHFGSSCSIYLLGGPKEQALFAEPWPGVHNTLGQLSLLENAALLASVDLLISNDSAFLHLAEAVGTPVFSLFGPTVQAFGFAPFLPESRVLEIPLPCRPCSLHGQGPCVYAENQACLKRISPESVIEQIEAFFAARSEQPHLSTKNLRKKP